MTQNDVPGEMKSLISTAPLLYGDSIRPRSRSSSIIILCIMMQALIISQKAGSSHSRVRC
jgi:hypothetical protein